MFMSSIASLDRLKFCNFKLKALLNFTQAINHNLPTNDILNSYEKLLHEELNIGKILLFDFNKKWEVILKSGFQDSDFIDIDVETDLLNIDDICTTWTLENKKLKNFDFIIPVFHNTKAIAYLLIGDVEEELEGISPSIKHVHFIQTLTNVIIVAIENKRLQEESLRQIRLKKELEMAADMQAMLVPDVESFPTNSFISIHPFYLPHYEVGGDYYDFDIISDHQMYFCVADVSGKGISAALLMSNFQANLKALFTTSESMEELIRKLNKIVLKNANGEKFITLFIAKYNYQTHKLVYINAGHNPPILYDKITKQVVYLEKGCVGLGMLDEINRIEVGKIELKNNSKLLCFTDGLSELPFEQTDDYGQIIIEKYLQTSDNIKNSIETILNELNINKENKNIFDDITILGMDFFV